jgi:hypothetical protein
VNGAAQENRSQGGVCSRSKHHINHYGRAPTVGPEQITILARSCELLLTSGSFGEVPWAAYTGDPSSSRLRSISLPPSIGRAPCTQFGCGNRDKVRAMTGSNGPVSLFHAPPGSIGSLRDVLSQSGRRCYYPGRSNSSYHPPSLLAEDTLLAYIGHAVTSLGDNWHLWVRQDIFMI